MTGKWKLKFPLSRNLNFIDVTKYKHGILLKVIDYENKLYIYSHFLKTKPKAVSICICMLLRTWRTCENEHIDYT